MNDAAGMNALPVQSWAPPGANGTVISRRRRVEDLQLLEREAWEKGLTAGRTAGEAELRREHQAYSEQLATQVQRLDQILKLLNAPLAALDTAVEAQLAEAVTVMARAVVRQELQLQPERIIALVRECVGRLPLTAREVRVHLHPDDAALIRERLAAPQAERAWQLVEDPVLSRGGCRISSENSTVDARVESLLQAATAALLGEERQPASRGVQP
jgi:flagellar assembly protein FliH